ncbi:MAG: sigma-70 family RNA polymerase sigma factor [Bacteroidaceae bacterium]|nr:sigma-70 family RNA polymerase sigma factor [Bacteroidaceae bacterium]
MNSSETHACIQSALCGEQEAYRQLYEVYSSSVFQTVARFANRAEVAEELTQDVFLRVFDALDTFDASKASFYTWVQRIAYHYSVSYLRSRKPPPLVSLNEDEAAMQHISETALQEAFDEPQSDTVEALMQIIEKLEPEEQHLLTLYYFEDRPLKEIAYIMDVHPPALSSRLSRIRKKIYFILTSSSHERSSTLR